MAIRLVLADDHPIVLEGLTRLLTPDEGFDVLATCRDGAEALRAVAEHRPDVLVLDLLMPVLDGLAVLRDLKDRGPRPGPGIVILTASLEEDDALAALQLGARGFLLKDLAPDLIVRCIRQVHAGEPWLERGVLVRATERLVGRRAGEAEAIRKLTPRELEIVRLLGAGLRNKHVADALSISESTVKVHLRNIYEKLGVDSRLALVLYARDAGLI
jgi:DNA-binding NarL/FixJ family response regulator